MALSQESNAYKRWMGTGSSGAVLPSSTKDATASSPASAHNSGGLGVGTLEGTSSFAFEEAKLKEKTKSASSSTGSSSDGCSGSIGMSGTRSPLNTESVFGKDGKSSYKLEAFTEASKPEKFTNVKPVHAELKKRNGIGAGNVLYGPETFGFNRFFNLSMGVAVLSMIFFGIFPNLKLREGHSAKRRFASRVERHDQVTIHATASMADTKRKFWSTHDAGKKVFCFVS